MGADVILPSLDAATEGGFRKINRPHPDLSVENYIGGLVSLRREFRGRILLEIFILPGYNDSREELAAEDRITTVRQERGVFYQPLRGLVLPLPHPSVQVAQGHHHDAVVVGDAAHPRKDIPDRLAVEGYFLVFVQVLGARFGETRGKVEVDAVVQEGGVGTDRAQVQEARGAAARFLFQLPPGAVRRVFSRIDGPGGKFDGNLVNAVAVLLHHEKVTLSCGKFLFASEIWYDRGPVRGIEQVEAPLPAVRSLALHPVKVKYAAGCHKLSAPFLPGKVVSESFISFHGATITR
jgi:hypothetical protein